MSEIPPCATTAKNTGQVFGHLDFKIVVEPSDAPAFTVVLLAPSRQEKAAWTSDISQVSCPCQSDSHTQHMGPGRGAAAVTLSGLICYNHGAPGSLAKVETHPVVGVPELMLLNRLVSTYVNTQQKHALPLEKGDLV